MSIPAPRPRDFLEAELLRFRDMRAERRWDDPDLERARRAAIDRRIDHLLDELAAVPPIPAQRRAPDDDPHLAGSRGQRVRAEA